jgi:hypothetical protein
MFEIIMSVRRFQRQFAATFRQKTATLRHGNGGGPPQDIAQPGTARQEKASGAAWRGILWALPVERRRQRMTSFHLSTSLLHAANVTTTWAASQIDAPTIHCLLDLLSLANGTAFTPPLVIVLALTATNNSMVRRLIVSAFRLGRRTLIYLVDRTGSIIVDRLLEMMIIALITMIASVSWLTGIARVLGRIFH